jgi:hypothetical protein
MNDRPKSGCVRQVVQIGDRRVIDGVLRSYFKLPIGITPFSVPPRAPCLGCVWGDQSQDLLAVYSGSGFNGDESIVIHGRADWPYDKQREDYVTADFRQMVKFERQSVWSWVAGAEIVAGGAIGADAAPTVEAGASVATGDLRLAPVLLL